MAISPLNPLKSDYRSKVWSGVQNTEAFEIFAKDHGLVDIKTVSQTVENPE
jgi:hypothetical protein